MVSGFVMSASERKRLVKRLEAMGLREKESRALARNTPVLDAKRARAMAKLAAAHVEALLTTVVSAHEEATRGLEFEVLYEFGRGFDTSLENYEALPGMILDRALKLTSADAGALMLVGEDPDVLRTIVSRGDESFKAPETLHIGEGMAGRAAMTGRSMVVQGAKGIPSEAASVAVPLRSEGNVLGVLLVSMPNAGREMAEELKLLDLYAETASTALANARRYSETSHLMLELMQLNELSRAIHGGSEADRITYLVTGVLDKVLDFEVGGLIAPERDGHGRIILRRELATDELLDLLGQVVGGEVEDTFLRSCEIVASDGGLSDLRTAVPPSWNIIAACLSPTDPSAGYLFAAASEPGTFSSADVRVLGAEAAHASVALDRARVYSQLNDELERLEKAVSAMLDSSGGAARGHADRVMAYSAALGEEMGLASEDVQKLRFAGLLHDIGKFGMPEEIILKPTELSEDETAQVRKHAEVGAEIVSHMDFLGALRPVIMHHHERWDGTGYPDGLSGEDIPMLSRILSVADALDAMTCERGYNEALPFESARSEIERESGRQFDPEVVQAFLRLMDREMGSATTGLFTCPVGEDKAGR
jgi:putative nucleotidyltransferase with HDIG domain